MLYNLLESVRIASSLLVPFMPESCEKIRGQIGAKPEQFSWEATGSFGVLPADVTVVKGEIIFPRLDLKKELEALENL